MVCFIHTTITLIVREPAFDAITLIFVSSQLLLPSFLYRHIEIFFNIDINTNSMFSFYYLSCISMCLFCSHWMIEIEHELKIIQIVALSWCMYLWHYREKQFHRSTSKFLWIVPISVNEHHNNSTTLPVKITNSIGAPYFYLFISF